jgi:hypothetical protein
VIVLAVAAIAAVRARGGRANANRTVSVVRAPGGGIQPQAVVDDAGTVHLVYFEGDPKTGDVYYVRREAGRGAFTPAIRVNTEPGTAIAAGTIRGARLAVDPRGRAHVVWNGSAPLDRDRPGSVPFWYARMNGEGTAFEAQRNVITSAFGLDGGGDVVASRDGRVYAVWHAGEHGKPESERAVFLARSSDGGMTFERERRISPSGGGVCGCCGLRAHADREGTVYVAYRDAGDGIHRDMDLLTSTDRGETFAFTKLQRWEVNACPMSSASIAEAERGVLVGWQNAEQVYFALADGTRGALDAPRAAPGAGAARKHPLALAGDGSILFAWTEGTGWAKGGSLHWQRYDVAGRPIGAAGTAAGVPVWSLPTGYVDPRGGGFVLVY